MPKFSDIIPLTRMGAYEISVPWTHIERQLLTFADCNLNMDPEFQRAHVWDDEKRRRYVEYILRGGHSSKVIYWNCAGWMGRWEGPMYLVDGKQRLEAIRKFLRNELPIFDGHYLKDFSDNLRTVIAEVRFHINDLPDYKSVLQWYLDLNDGGVIHTKEELDKVRHLLALQA